MDLFINCSRCGAKNYNTAFRCAKCHEILQEKKPSNELSKKVPNYLTQAILLIFWAAPFGIIATIYAVRVNKKLLSGDYEGAKSASDKAKMWCWVGFIIGLVPYLLIIVITLLSVG